MSSYEQRRYSSYANAGQYHELILSGRVCVTLIRGRSCDLTDLLIREASSEPFDSVLAHCC